MFRQLRVKWWGEAQAQGSYPTCHLCKKPILTFEELTVDHEQPRTGGSHPIRGCHDDRAENLKPAHGLCNSKKGSRRIKHEDFN